VSITFHKKSIIYKDISNKWHITIYITYYIYNRFNMNQIKEIKEKWERWREESEREMIMNKINKN